MGGKRERIALFDNIKGLLIILVTVAHFMLPIQSDNPVLSTVFDGIYLFHMPLFVFVSGLFAKGAYRDGRLNWNRIISFVLLGVAFQVLLYAVNGNLFDRLHRIPYFSSAPWYLISMAWWYLATPVLARLAPPIGVLASLALSLASSVFDFSSGFLALGRAISFLPYFALGYYCATGTLRKVAESRWLWLAVAGAAVVMGLRMLDPHAFDWFFYQVYGDNPYRDPSSIAGVIQGIAQKLTAVAGGTLMSLAVLRLIPRKHSYLTILGERTLQIYVIHRVIRAALSYRTDFYDLPVLLDPLWGSAIILALSGGVVALCALKVFTPPFTWLMAKRWLPERNGSAK